MKILIKTAVIILQLNLLAQTSEIVDINNFHLPFNNRGFLSDVVIDSQSQYGTYNGKIVLWSGGFYLSGYSDTTLWANGSERNFTLAHYQSGLIGSAPTDSNNIIYSVATVDPPFGKSWQNWEKAVEQGAYYYDGDENGIYDPIDHNGNGNWDIWEDRPDLLYDAVFFTVYNDAVPSEDRKWENSFPVGIEVRQTVFASEQNENLADVVFLRYSLLYNGLGNPNEPDSLTDVIFSISTDPDIGGTAVAAHDDMLGCDTLLQAGYNYNDGEDEDWGMNPPALFKVIVQGPLIKTGNYEDKGYNRKGPYIGENLFQGYRNGIMNAFMGRLNAEPHVPYPQSAEDARQYMLGRLARTGEFPNPCEFYYGNVTGGINCTEVNPALWFSGDPVNNNGWLFTEPGNIYDLTSTQSFTLIKGIPQDIMVAYVVGQGTDALNSITKAREITRYVHEEYERNFSTIVSVDDNPEEVVNEFTLSQNYPNPFNPTTTIQYTVSNVVDENFRPLRTQLIVYNILGQVVKTLVNEVKASGTYEVNFDASQLSSGVYFYKLQSGSFIQTKKMMVIK